MGLINPVGYGVAEGSGRETEWPSLDVGIKVIGGSIGAYETTKSRSG